MDSKSKLNSAKIRHLLKKYELNSTEKIISFLNAYKDRYSFFDLSKIAENANQMRMQNSAYYTDEELLSFIKKDLPLFNDKKEIRILEPSVGVGNFLPIIFEKYNDKKIILDVVDIDEDSLRILKTLIRLYNLPGNIVINYIHSDFCEFNITDHYDLAVGNPPFSKVKREYLKSLAKKYYYNFDSKNLASYFYEKCCCVSDYVCLIMPKNVLNTPEYLKTRSFLKNKAIETIFDFGEKGFNGVLVETVYIKTNTKRLPGFTNVVSLPRNIVLKQKQGYICDEALPYWVIFRNDFFDSFLNNYEFGLFRSIRDRQITSKLMTKSRSGIRVIKSRNISDDGQLIENIPGYDGYIEKDVATKLAIYKYLDNDNVYMTPNMTYNTRVMKKPNGVLTNGSVAILIPKKDVHLSKEQLTFFSSNQYRDFMQIARNYQTRSLNIDSASVYFFGIRR